MLPNTISSSIIITHRQSYKNLFNLPIEIGEYLQKDCTYIIILLEKTVDSIVLPNLCKQISYFMFFNV